VTFLVVPPKDRIALKPYINVDDFELDKKSSHFEWQKIFRYFFANHVDSTIHCKININASVRDVENIHDMFGVP
jgi:hypothetical protein